MGIVFLARDPVLRRLVAVKVLRPELATAAAAQRFLKEARLVARLTHPNVVTVFQAAERDGLFFYVMEHVEGETLAARLAREGRLPVRDVNRLARDRATSTVFRAVEADRERPWSGVFGLARGGLLRAPGVGGAAAGAIAALATALPEWADRFPAARSATPGDPGHALSETVGAATAEGPVVLVVDDAHHLDRESLAALTAALRDWPARPLLAILASEPHPQGAALDPIRAAIGKDLPGISLRLHPLTAPDLASLVRWAAPGRDEAATARLVRRIATDSGGYPLLAVELLHGVGAGLRLTDDASSWPRSDETLSETYPGDLPDNVVGAIRVGFRRLSPDAQRVLAVAAALDERIDPGVLERAVALSQPRLDRALGELEWTRWLVAAGDSYTFVARIVRAIVARDFLTAADRRRLLARAGNPDGA